jgi:uncharacterized membrane protein
MGASWFISPVVLVFAVVVMPFVLFWVFFKAERKYQHLKDTKREP